MLKLPMPTSSDARGRRRGKKASNHGRVCQQFQGLEVRRQRRQDDQTSSGGRQSAGGKAMRQKLGAGASNSTGMWKPSGISRAARTTRQPIFSFVPLCSRTSRACSGRLCRITIRAPRSLTLKVVASMVVGRPSSATCMSVRTRRRTRWPRRRSSRTMVDPGA